MNLKKVELIKRHNSWGLMFLLVMSLRVYWRITNENPIVSYSIRNWQTFAARFLHLSIYVVVFTQSLIGIINNVKKTNTFIRYQPIFCMH